MSSASPHPQVFLPRPALAQLVQHLQHKGYSVIGRVLRDGVASFQPIQTADQLLQGMRDQQDGGRYRLTPGEPGMLFEHVVGPDGPRQYLFPPSQDVLSFHVQSDGFVIDAVPPAPKKLALLGIRPCELAAIGVQDRVFGLQDQHPMRCESEPYYTQSRQQAVTIVANCVRPGGTCFCLSMGTGPEATSGFDLAMTELRDGFVIAIGSKTGAELLEPLPSRPPSSTELELAELKLMRAREHMGRTLDTSGLPQLLRQTIEHPYWDEVATRCLSCGNCTMVCPTCFCSTVQDSTDLKGVQAKRTRQWESCFTHQFSYLTAGPVRHTIRGRYRHWMRHKLGTWHDQFGCSGCVGCGRCITWCPVGIDLTREAARLRQDYHPDVVAPGALSGGPTDEEGSDL